MFVKSITWCSVTVVAVLAAALLTTAPVSAHSDDTHQNTQTQNQNDGDNDRDDKNFKLKDPIVNMETGACVFKGEDEGTIGVDVTNPNHHKVTYKVTLDGKTKTVEVDGGKTEYVPFTHLSIGDYTAEVTGPHGTKASGSASIIECHEHELPTVTVDACGCVNADQHNGHLTLTIQNTNDYAVTYTIRIDGHSKDVFVDAHATNTVTFDCLKAGDYEISISGDDCTHLCMHATVKECEQQTQPGQGGGTTTPVTPVTPPAPVVTPAAPAAQTTLPAQLPNTSATDTAPAAPATVVAKVQAPKTASAASLLLVALGLPMIVAAAVLRRQRLNNEA